MRRGAGVAIRARTLFMLWVSTLPLFAQAPQPPLSERTLSERGHSFACKPHADFSQRRREDV